MEEGEHEQVKTRRGESLVFKEVEHEEDGLGVACQERRAQGGKGLRDERLRVSC